MRVKVLGGYVRINRRWTNHGWEWNSRWNPILNHQGLTQAVESGGIAAGPDIFDLYESEEKLAAVDLFGKKFFQSGERAGTGRPGRFVTAQQQAGSSGIDCKQLYQFYFYRNELAYRPEAFTLSDENLGCISSVGNVYHSLVNHTITKNGDDYTWRDRHGNLIFYKNNEISYYEDRNHVRVSFDYDSHHIKTIRDHNGNVVITYHWQHIDNGGLAGSNFYQLTSVEDYSGRTVQYRYGEDSSNLITYRRLIEVIDVRGESWKYQYKIDSNTKKITLDTMTDPNGKVITYSTNADGHVNGFERADGSGETYSHSVDSNKVYKVTHTEKSGVITERWYNALNMAIKKQVGGQLQFETKFEFAGDRTAKDIARQYQSVGGYNSPLELKPIRILNSVTKDARGLETKKYYDTFRNVTRTEYPDGTYTTTDWNTVLTLPVRERDQRGIITEYEYDDRGNLITLTEAVGTPDQRITRYTYDQYGQMLTQTTGESAAGNTALATAHWEYDSYGNVTKVTDPEQKVTEYQSYDINGNAHTIVDARLKSWTHDYDAVGNLLSDLNPYDQGFSYEYDAAGDLVMVTDASGSSLHIVNNASGLPLTVTDDSGNELALTYDKGNRLATITDAEQSSIGLEYDGQNRLRAVVDGEQNRTEYNYQQNLLHKIDYPTYSEELGYDKRDRIEQSKQKANNLEYLRSYGYDLGDNLTSDTDALENTERYEYDKLNRLVAIIDPVNGETKKTEFSYDARDNLLQVEDPEGRLTVYTYDKNDRLKTETKHDFIGTNKQRVYDYDANGNLVAVTNPEQEERAYSYDDANRLSKLQVYANKDSAQPIKVVDYHYNAKAQYTGYTQAPGADTANATADIVNHRETYSYDSLNRLELVTVDYFGEGAQAAEIVFSKSYSYSYYGNGLKKTYTNPEGITYTYYYNKNNQLAAVHIPGEGQLAWTDFDWLAPQTLLLPGGNRITLSYDDFLRVKQRILEDSASNDKARAVYEYDLESNIRKISTEHGDYNFGYDKLYRLTQADYPAESAANDEQFVYDGVGNRTGHSDGEVEGEDFTPSTSQELQYNEENQLTAISGDETVSFQYNDNGHTTQKVQSGVTWDYHYNHEERLIAVDKDGTTVGQYRYNPYGQRIRKQTGQVTYFLYNEEGMAAEYDQSGKLIKEYHFKPGMPWMTEPLFQRVSTGEIYYYQNDHLGTPQRMVDKFGAVVWDARYEAFGKAEILTETVENNLRLPGQYFDLESGLNQNLFRDYDPKSGRYLEVDPIGLLGGLNGYRYANASPSFFLDPLGLLSFRDVMGFVPVVGSLLNAYDAFRCGNLGEGLLNLGLALAEATGTGLIVKGLTVGTMKWAARKEIKQIYKQSRNWPQMRRKLQNKGHIPKNSSSTPNKDWATTDHIFAKQRGNMPHSVKNHPANLQTEVSQSMNSKFEHMSPMERALHLPGWMKGGAAGAGAYGAGQAMGSGSCEC
ncbi:RHS repeat-associated core domain-containing protein [Microbulbifer hainanensis]|uniref:RHS repeat-associated core domain-containing protein n=1 Tax=Microbulbifer hainanensis TaxID=2735675 RepID=UPI001D023DB1|nr:RHS repeat-associated core domain-containing protein [Microbulbifer hainanensis]